MQLPFSAAAASRLIVLPEIGSTNDELKAVAATAPEFTVVATTNQTAGRGRLGRVWVAKPGKTLAVSVLLKPEFPGGLPVPVGSLGWIPLMAGAAMALAVESLVSGHSVSLKWPNDVLIDGSKVSGLLAELVPPAAIVVGAGLNLELAEDELPTPTSTSLLINGVTGRGDALVDAALSAYLTRLRSMYGEFLASGADAAASGLRDTVLGLCSTVGNDVRVELPSGEVLAGRAETIDDSGRIIVRTASDRKRQAVAAGDVTHLRYE